ncbi:antibiotic biosynthesis monooxygenase family protein [Thermoactinospora rubra]|uniref:antibiotic biosynthesis monooxygenase family protein n=1 Tax=Thermoactinospora rubra TaxID=1088767 RepID=UPI000A0F7402|nr:antibiotic biosynthesis monooxygenase [Thermoactinospora rubra]
MVIRTWRGWTRPEDAEAYESYLLRTGFPGYTGTPGNHGVYFTRRQVGDRVEFFLISLWESWEAIKAFAGEDPSRAVFYLEDDRYLVDKELTVEHYEVFASA